MTQTPAEALRRQTHYLYRGKRVTAGLYSCLKLLDQDIFRLERVLVFVFELHT